MVKDCGCVKEEVKKAAIKKPIHFFEKRGALIAIKIYVTLNFSLHSASCHTRWDI